MANEVMPADNRAIPDPSGEAVGDLGKANEKAHLRRWAKCTVTVPPRRIWPDRSS